MKRMNEKEMKERLTEIIRIAVKLKWVLPTKIFENTDYPLMQLSEVEKCMVAMVDDFEFERMKQWEKDFDKLKKLGQDKTSDLHNLCPFCKSSGSLSVFTERANKKRFQYCKNCQNIIGMVKDKNGCEKVEEKKDKG